MNLPLDIIRQSGQAQEDVRDHYESVTLAALQALWRRRHLFAATVLLTLAAAMAILVFLPRYYTAEALIQLDFARRNAGTAPAASVEASALVESDVRYISSRPMARKVATRFASADGGGDFTQADGLTQFFGELRGAFLPETVVTDPVEKAAIMIGKRLQVANVTRAYLISIRFMADTPQKAADVANAFAAEYFSEKHMQDLVRREAEAGQEIAKLTATHGDQHPSLLAARERFALMQTQLGEEKNRIGVTPSHPPAGIGFIAAQPVATPSSPQGKLFLAIALLLGGALGVGAVWFAERRDVGFRTADEVFRTTGVRCAGVLPDQDPEQIREAIRALCLETGILGYDKAPKVVLISTPLTDDPSASFAAELAQVLVEAGRRVLSIDATPFSGKLQDGAALAMGRALMDEQALEGFLGTHGEDRHTVFHRGNADGGSPLQSVDRLVAAARKSYDVALVRTAPVLSSSDALRLVSIADLHLHVVRWQETQRRPTLLAVQRFRKIGARVSGIVLVDANLRRYRQYRPADQFYYSGGDSVGRREALPRSTALNKERAAAK